MALSRRVRLGVRPGRLGLALLAGVIEDSDSEPKRKYCRVPALLAVRTDSTVATDFDFDPVDFLEEEEEDEEEEEEEEEEVSELSTPCWLPRIVTVLRGGSDIPVEISFIASGVSAYSSSAVEATALNTSLTDVLIFVLREASSAILAF